MLNLLEVSVKLIINFSTKLQEPLGISERQLEKFRALEENDQHEKLVNNMRPPQPLNGRKVYEIQIPKPHPTQRSVQNNQPKKSNESKTLFILSFIFTYIGFWYMIVFYLLHTGWTKSTLTAQYIIKIIKILETPFMSSNFDKPRSKITLHTNVSFGKKEPFSLTHDPYKNKSKLKKYLSLFQA